VKRSLLLVVAVATLIAAGCAGTATPPPNTTPSAENRYLVDPRTGAPAAADASLDRRFEAAWQSFLASDYANARTRLADVTKRDAAYAPAVLLSAALDWKEGRTDTARSEIASLEQRYPDWTAPKAYEAEIALADHQTRRAWEIYRDLASHAGAPAVVRDRLSDLSTRLFDELYNSALNATDTEAIAALRQALEVSPNATAARTLLAQKLIAQKQYDEARTALDPLLNSGEVDKAPVQEALAEIEIGRGQYEQAIVRYERLARRESDPRYARRLDQVKEVWNAANMPPQFQNALASLALTRGDFAVLTYWLVPSVRFAQNVGTPPIAIDLTDVAGREEIVRAIALGVLQVDPVTRRVGPSIPMNEAQLEKFAGRLLLLRGAACARNVPAETIVQACGVTTTAASGDAAVTGHDASVMLQQIAKVLAR
jgi:tetratricopeptide (TPR) repeat protein